MEVKVLSITFYDAIRYLERVKKVMSPTWEQIEQNIRAMDRAERPFVSLRLHDGKEGCLNVAGGAGVYCMESFDGKNLLHYFDPSKYVEDEREEWDEKWECIELYTYAGYRGYDEPYMCYDLDIVLKVAHHFAQFGQLSPSVVWR